MERSQGRRASRHKNVKCSRCPFKGRLQRGMVHFIKTHTPLQQVPFLCSVCQHRGDSFMDVKKHAQLKHRGVECEVIMSSSPYVPTLSSTCPEAPDLIVQDQREEFTEEGQQKSDINVPTASATSTFTEREPLPKIRRLTNQQTEETKSHDSQGVLRQALEATSTALAASTDNSVIRDTLTCIKTQVVTANLNITQVKAKVASLEASTRRIDSQLPTLAEQIQQQVDLRGPASSLSQSAERIKTATEHLATSVEGFKDGLFGLVQTLVAEQKVLARQMATQATAFQELVKTVTQATSTSVLPSPQFYDQGAFDTMWEEEGRKMKEERYSPEEDHQHETDDEMYVHELKDYRMDEVGLGKQTEITLREDQAKLKERSGKVGESRKQLAKDDCTAGKIEGRLEEEGSSQREYKESRGGFEEEELYAIGKSDKMLRGSVTDVIEEDREDPQTREEFEIDDKSETSKKTDSVTRRDATELVEREEGKVCEETGKGGEDLQNTGGFKKQEGSEAIGWTEEMARGDEIEVIQIDEKTVETTYKTDNKEYVLQVPNTVHKGKPQPLEVDEGNVLNGMKEMADRTMKEGKEMIKSKKVEHQEEDKKLKNTGEPKGSEEQDKERRVEEREMKKEEEKEIRDKKAGKMRESKKQKESKDLRKLQDERGEPKMKKGENVDGGKEKSKKKPEKKECNFKEKAVEKTKRSDSSWRRETRREGHLEDDMVSPSPRGESAEIARHRTICRDRELEKRHREDERAASTLERQMREERRRSDRWKGYHIPKLDAFRLSRDRWLKRRRNRSRERRWRNHNLGERQWDERHHYRDYSPKVEGKRKASDGEIRKTSKPDRVERAEEKTERKVLADVDTSESNSDSETGTRSSGERASHMEDNSESDEEASGSERSREPKQSWKDTTLVVSIPRTLVKR